MSDCKKPCLTTSVSLTKRSSSVHKLEYHSIYFAIPSNIQTTTIKEDSFNLMVSLNFLGSNLDDKEPKLLVGLLQGVEQGLEPGKVTDKLEHPVTGNPELLSLMVR